MELHAVPTHAIKRWIGRLQQANRLDHMLSDLFAALAEHLPGDHRRNALVLNGETFPHQRMRPEQVQDDSSLDGPIATELATIEMSARVPEIFANLQLARANSIDLRIRQLRPRP